MTILNPKNREIFTVSSGSLSQSTGRGRISREGALDLRESRERRDKIFATKTENAKIKKKWIVRKIVFSGAEFSSFWPRENYFFWGGGYNFKTD